ncbi:MAG: 16S rRNA (cytosine(1402)-N(4))-methyltransferase RsmH [Elusimicrobiota bacterium]|nr:16S rRNA (cytosine(1402)-N(4))-methyltransferase RsmH [Elusimicrobiota bacterium]
MYHIPIMPYEISQVLISNPNGIFVDATFGGGGHSAYLLEKFKNIKIIAFDWDEDSFNNFSKNQNLFENRITFIRENFKNIRIALLARGISEVNGILADIGVSSKQFDDLKRGFSFNSDCLDMRMDNRNTLTAQEIINTYSQESLADIFYKYGQEYRSRQIAKAIIKRKARGIINTAQELRSIIVSVKRQEGKIDPATKVFQALRIVVNDELANLENLLDCAPTLLKSGGVFAIMSFHSLEDRLIKQNFKNNAKNGIYSLINRKVISPNIDEIKNNSRSASAKLRAVKRL